jgi:hypothetical protein
MKNGKPLMWSQCRCDMNTWYTWPRPGPCSASTELAKTRAPLPRSHSTYSSPPASSCTHDELPPNVWETSKGSSCSTNARARSGVSRLWPAARVSATTSLAWSARASSGAGIEPRVPQNLTRTAVSAAQPRSSAASADGEIAASASRTDG